MIQYDEINLEHPEAKLCQGCVYHDYFIGIFEDGKINQEARLDICIQRYSKKFDGECPLLKKICTARVSIIETQKVIRECP